MEKVKFKDENFSEIARLRSRWIMTEAANIMEAKNLSRSEAMTKAWCAWRLLDALSQGKVSFCYQKIEGDTRWALGTLCRGTDYLFDQYLELHDGELRQPKKETPCSFVYWDCEKKGFRTFKSYHLLWDMHVFSLKGLIRDEEEE